MDTTQQSAFNGLHVKDVKKIRGNSIVCRTGLKWVEYLEREFDTAFVDLDSCLNNLDDENSDVAFDARNKMTALAGSFSQLVHKAILVFESNARLEEEMDFLKNEVVQSKTEVQVLKEQLQRNVAENALNLQQHGYSSQPHQNHNSPLSRNNGLVEGRKGYPALAMPVFVTGVPSEDPSSCKKDIKKSMLLKQQEVANYKRENKFLRNYILSLQSDLFGARLSSKYLDKELAGRIQQIQLLAKSDLKGVEHDRLWNQLEAEIHLHRHKTVVKACRARATPSMVSPSKTIRTVKVVKTENEGLGISITGGKEHGIPIIISDIHTGSPADKSGSLYIGDAILSINEIDLRELKHSDSVDILSTQTGDCLLEVMFLYPEEEVTNGVDRTQDKSFEEKYNFLDPEIMGPELNQVLKDVLKEGGDIDSREDMETHPGSRRRSSNDSTESNFSQDNLSSVTDVINRRQGNLYPGVARLCVSEQPTCSSKETAID